MTARLDSSAVSAVEAVRLNRRDPAMEGYADHLRRKKLIGASTPLPAESPYDEARAGEFEVRRSMAMRNARP